MLEDILDGEGNRNRRKLRSAISMSASRPTNTSPKIFPDPLLIARTTCRVIAPDELFQFFTREQCARSNTSKRLFAEALPNIYRLTVGVIAMNSGENVEKCVSALGRHLSKCGDRKKSKELLEKTKQSEELDRTINMSDSAVISDSY